MRRLGITTLLAISFIAGNYPLFQPSHNALASPDLIADTPTRTSLQQQVNFERHFKELGVEGSILIYDLNRDQFYQHNPDRNSTAFAPASTFKIFNSLVALETGVIPDEKAIIPWDGIKRDLNEWNQDLNLRQSIKYSAVWFYQVLARRIGHDRMQNFINRVGYGNRQIGTKEAIDTFWLNGNLRITPREQIEFLRHLYRGDLPFSKRTIDIVKDIMIVEQTPNYILRGKTGWIKRVTPPVGWFVGYLEQNQNVYFFATNIDIGNPNDAAARLQAARLEITRRSLLELGLLEAQKL
jgi:beta-lactamase class D